MVVNFFISVGSHRFSFFFFEETTNIFIFKFTWFNQSLESAWQELVMSIPVSAVVYDETVTFKLDKSD